MLLLCYAKQNYCLFYIYGTYLCFFTPFIWFYDILVLLTIFAFYSAVATLTVHYYLFYSFYFCWSHYEKWFYYVEYIWHLLCYIIQWVSKNEFCNFEAEKVMAKKVKIHYYNPLQLYSHHLNLLLSFLVWQTLTSNLILNCLTWNSFHLFISHFTFLCWPYPHY